jgi:hypothetical protein
MTSTMRFDKWENTLGQPVGTVLQVVSTNYTGTVSSTSATPVNVSGFSANITPKFNTSKILVLVSVAFGFANDAYPYVLLTRNGTSIGTGASATGAQINTFLSGTGTTVPASTPFRFHQAAKNFLDSPNTTSALTYQIQFASPYASIAGYINRQGPSDNTVYIQYPSSSITLMEIAQ